MGTLTAGMLTITEIEVLDPAVDEGEMLRFAASVEAVSEHPIARAIVRAADARGIELRPVGDFRALTGQGEGN